MHSDPIADMLTRIRNAQAVKKPTVDIPISRLNSAIINILKTEGYVKDVLASGDMITIALLYDKNGKPKIKRLKRISKPGRRIYEGKRTLPSVLNERGIAVVSTSKGLMTNKQAKGQNLGGEIVCEVY